VYANVVCKWVCRSVGLLSASYVFQVLCIGSGCFDACVVPVETEVDNKSVIVASC